MMDSIIFNPNIPKCNNGHIMIFNEYESSNTFICDQCSCNSSSLTFDGTETNRWKCIECDYDLCFTCHSDYIFQGTEAQFIVLQSKINQLEANLPELAESVSDKQGPRLYLMRKFDMASRFSILLSNITDKSDENLQLIHNILKFFARETYCIIKILRSITLVSMITNVLDTSVNESVLIAATSCLINLTRIPSLLNTNQILFNIPQFIPNLLKNSNESILSNAIDILQNFSSSDQYKETAFNTLSSDFLRILPSLFTHLNGITTKITYFLWCLVSSDDNKSYLCSSDELLLALKHVIITNFDEARANAFGVLWNLASLASNKVNMCRSELGFLPILMSLMNDSDEQVKLSSLGIISNLSVEVSNKPLLLLPSLSLIQSLVTIVRSDLTACRITACQTLSNLAGVESGALDILQSGVHIDLLSIIKNAPSDPSLWEGGSNEKVFALTCTMNLTEWESARQQLKDASAVEILSSLLPYDHFQSLTASMAYAFLIGRDEQGPHVEILRKVVIIQRLVDLLSNTLRKTGGDGYQYGLFRLKVVIHACLELSMSDGNKEKLATPNVRDHLIEVIQNASPNGKGVDVYNSITDVTQAASYAIDTLLQLSFIYEDSNELISPTGLYPSSCNLSSVLTTFAEYSNSAIIGTSIGLLLSRISPSSDAINAVTGKGTARVSSIVSTSDVDGKHIMLSYCWKKAAKPELVASLAMALRSKGYEVWRDVEGSAYVAPITGSTDETMALAIERSAVVIIFVSKEYKQSPNCRMEANYANQRHKKGKVQIIYVMMQEEYTTVSEPESVDGYLAIMIGDKLWCPLFTEDKLANVVEFISGKVGDRAKHIEGYTRGITYNELTIVQDSIRINGNDQISNEKVVRLEAKIQLLESNMESLVSVVEKMRARIEFLEGTRNGFFC